MINQKFDLEGYDGSAVRARENAIEIPDVLDEQGWCLLPCAPILRMNNDVSKEESAGPNTLDPSECLLDVLLCIPIVLEETK